MIKINERGVHVAGQLKTIQKGLETIIKHSEYHSKCSLNSETKKIAHKTLLAWLHWRTQ